MTHRARHGFRRLRLCRPASGAPAGAAGLVVRARGARPDAALFLKPMGNVGQIVPMPSTSAREGRGRGGGRASTS